MRLVSAIWGDYHPFDMLPGIKEFACVEHPDELKPGDSLIIHGGEDISPSIYNKGRSSFTHAGPMPGRRDKIEVALMKRARELEIPVFGICRGAQLLCALNGGILVQHIYGHSGHHEIKTFDNNILSVNSIHHQMQFPWTGKCKHELVAWAKYNLSKAYFGEDNEYLEVDCEPEFVYYPEVKGFGIQWHPEMMDADSEASKYVLQYISDKLKLY